MHLTLRFSFIILENVFPTFGLQFYKIHSSICCYNVFFSPLQVPAVGIPAPKRAQPLGTISATSWGSTLILPISYTYIAMMGSKGLTKASKIATLNANYMAKRLEVLNSSFSSFGFMFAYIC